MQDGLVQVFENVEFADLMRDIAENSFYCSRIQIRSVGRNAENPCSSGRQRNLDPNQEATNVISRWVVFQYPISQSTLPRTIYGREYAEWSVVQLVNDQVSRKVGCYPVEVVTFDSRTGFFPAFSTQSWMVANGMKTRWSRHMCQELILYGKPSSTTRRTAIEMTSVV